MAHPNARLSVFGRQLLVSRVAQGWPASEAAKQLGVSRATAYKWLRRYRAEGQAGLLDRRSRPHRSPRRLADDQVSAILRARTRRRYGPHRLAPLTGHPPSTIYAVLRRAGLQRLRDADRLTAAPVRYVACHPGALLHVDHKKLGRVPPGGGHRVLGRAAAPHHGHSNVGYEHLEVFVDDASRLAVLVPVADERGVSAARALETAAAEFATAGIRIERVLTRQWGQLSQPRVRCGGGRPGRPSPAHPTVPAADQWQGRALHPDPVARVGLRAALPLQCSPPGGLTALGRLLQSGPTPHRAARTRPRAAVNNVPEHHI